MNLGMDLSTDATAIEMSPKPAPWPDQNRDLEVTPLPPSAQGVRFPLSCDLRQNPGTRRATMELGRRHHPVRDEHATLSGPGL